uniref:ORF4 protein n=1 Tax=Cacao swollen shoot virus TaxID=31559 RepID=A0A2H4U916_9VIRU|nr:ORF4 protein [Cacao swollen shoot virus]
MNPLNIQRILKKILFAGSLDTRRKNRRRSQNQSNGETCSTTLTWFCIYQKLVDLLRLKPSLILVQLPVVSMSTPFPKQPLNRTLFWFSSEASIPHNQWIKS